jgi:hypothetical protein
MRKAILQKNGSIQDLIHFSRARTRSIPPISRPFMPEDADFQIEKITQGINLNKWYFKKKNSRTKSCKKIQMNQRIKALIRTYP